MPIELSGKIVGLFAGSVKNRWEGKEPSAIGKQPVNGILDVLSDGFSIDQQADRNNHGGEEMALHHYSSEHMDFWKLDLPTHSDHFKSGCFGENISTTGLTEENTCIGDTFSFGTSLIQVSQGRQPCWKLNAHVGNEQMAMRFRKTALTGWYYRVLREGTVSTDDTMALVERTQPEWTMKRVIEARFNPKLEPSIAKMISSLSTLSPEWRQKFTDKLA